MESCSTVKLQYSSSFGLHKGVVSSERVSASWGDQVVKANHLKTQRIASGPQRIQTNLIRSVLTPFVDQESHEVFTLIECLMNEKSSFAASVWNTSPYVAWRRQRFAGLLKPSLAS
ncbi:unnamed protein product [Arabis nemorensis]|uniref:Uncharacterized protein n=1 Tax=Arabis nemorensis TaxID=586526 RepID=A0A565ANT3_9BRAS|nr:unnamed protein product [Arabis nemorensis]